MSAWQGRGPAARRRFGTASGLGDRPRTLSLPLEFRVPYPPTPIRQRTPQLCWATVATLLASWRDKTSYGVEDFFATLGEPWASKVIGPATSGLSWAEQRRFLARLGLQAEPPANYTAPRWETFLRRYGPLWVTADFSAYPGLQGVHSHLVIGIHGTSEGPTSVDVIDPWTGTEERMLMTDLVAKYEQLAGTPFAGLQIAHWPRDAQRSAQQSRAWAREDSARLSEATIAPAAVAGAVVTVAGAGWTVFTRATEQANGLVWEQAELKGTRAAGDDPAREPLKTARDYQLGTVRSKNAMQYDALFTDRVGAEFEVMYRYNGTCLRDITISNIDYAPPVTLLGRKFSVTSKITPASEHERGDVAAVMVEFAYRHLYAGGSGGTFVDRIVVFGDGRTPIRTQPTAG